jgi:hypothetical protein
MNGRRNKLKHPFEVEPVYLRSHLDEFVQVTINDLSSEFLLLPKGECFIGYADFRDAYEVLKKSTGGFERLEISTVHSAVLENSRVLGVLRAMLGMTPPQWADLARIELDSDVSQSAARRIDSECRADAQFVAQAEKRFLSRVSKRPEAPRRRVTLDRIDALITIAVRYLTIGAPDEVDGVIHRLAKFDTQHGLESLRYAAQEEVPYAVLLYERYLGRPFATHQDAVSELVGEVMENAIEDRLRANGITYRKTKRAERIPKFGQAPDFCIPDEIKPVVVIEAKITSDDGTARDKVARIKVLASQRVKHIESGMGPYEVIACIDGRGFRQRREDMRQMLLELDGKVFTTATLDQLVTHTRLKEFVTVQSERVAPNG